MASSGKSKRSRLAAVDLAAHVAARLKNTVAPHERVLLGLSGGVDSVVLLDVLARLQRRLRFDLHALHVNHQISPNAAEWARFCRTLSRERDVPCKVVKVVLPRGNSVERAAREARYAALRDTRATLILLAHNADDQAETVLLQLLRGAGVKGLAAMPLLRDEGGRFSDDGKAPARILRPLLDVPRTDIVTYAKARKLSWIEDESNADVTYLRNWLRHDLVPRVASRVPGYRATLTRAARNFAEAAELLDDLARLDAGDTLESGVLSLPRLRGLSSARAKNLLRYAIAQRGWQLPDAVRLEEALRQALDARRDARILVDLGACELRRHGDALHLLASEAAPANAGAVVWLGERSIVLPHLGGTLTMTPRRGSGLSVVRLNAEPVTVRPRVGGERLQPDADRPTRTVKNLLQEAKVPEWERSRVPFIYSGNVLAAIPGVAMDHRFSAARGEPSVLPAWRRWSQ